MTTSSLRAPALVLTALLAVPALAACSDDSPSPRQAADPLPASTTGPATSPASSSASSSAGSSPSSTATPGPAQATPSRTKVVLFGDQLGPAKVGDPFRQAVTALSAVLGKPTADPTTDTSCASAEDEVEWGDFRVGSSDGKLAGWVSTSTTLATPSGVHAGTSRAVLERVYGSRLNVLPSTPDAGITFDVTGTTVAGSLDTAGRSGTVSTLFTGVCSPP